METLKKVKNGHFWAKNGVYIVLGVKIKSHSMSGKFRRVFKNGRMHYVAKQCRKRVGNSNRPKMQLVRFDHLAQNGVEIKFLNTLTSSGECLGVVGVVRSAF